MNLSKNHLRQNIFTEQWIIYSPERAKRPKHSVRENSRQINNLPEKDSHCPFCPGNEKMVPEIISEITVGVNNKWSTRTVPNKYPVLTTDDDIKGGNKGPYPMTSAFGKHEVIIENPLHNKDIPVMPLEQVAQILKTYAQRYKFLLNNYKGIYNITIFRNHGPASGTSLVHPHSQIVGMSIIPKYIHDREAIAKSYFKKKRRCPLCDIIEYEKYDNERFILENNSFISFVPFASEVPFEVWIVPKRHCADYSEISELEIRDLAYLLRDVLIGFNDGLNNPDYNYVIYSCSRQKKTALYLHWYIQIKPKTTIPAGFEIGSGVHINPSLPENDAKILREQINSQRVLESNDAESKKDARTSRC